MPLTDRFETAALSADERFLAAGDAEGTVYLWTRKGRAIALAAKSSSAVRQVAFSPNGRLLVAGFDHGTVIVFDTQNERVWGRIELPSQRASFLWWTADGMQLVIDTRHFRFEVAPTRRAASTLESRSLHAASARALPQGTNYFVDTTALAIIRGEPIKPVVSVARLEDGTFNVTE